MMELLVLWQCWYSQEQETVIQSRRGGVTKIASRSVRGGGGHTLVVASDIIKGAWTNTTIVQIQSKKRCVHLSDQDLVYPVEGASGKYAYWLFHGTLHLLQNFLRLPDDNKNFG